VANVENVQSLLLQANHARDSAQWPLAAHLYSQLLQAYPQSAELAHNLGLCQFAAGNTALAIVACQKAIGLNPRFWQSMMILAKSYQAFGQIGQAQQCFQGVLKLDAANAQARLGLANITLNEYGDPQGAIELVKPLQGDTEYAMDAQLTSLMAQLYDRPQWNTFASAKKLSKDIRTFSSEHLRLPDLHLEPLSDRSKAYANPSYRPRVGLLSPQFGISPVYFLTIAGWHKIAPSCDIVIFNRGHQSDFASQEFKSLASEWIDVAHWSAPDLARRIHDADLDVLYDLGGWMDPIALQALSVKPARKQFKWVGGQSATTGLESFDGWIGDECQSPASMQALYSEPLIQIPGAYASYTPPPYLPKPSLKKSKTPCIFSNPAKVSSPFLKELASMPGKKVFIHRQYRFPQVQERIASALDGKVEFVIPTTHEEALKAVNHHAVMLDTFPYSSGLTAREALAMGTKIKVLKIGNLFCERHTAFLAQHQNLSIV
jgi:predicted O-linked N-acetylglucosamine transferase (SPINDLY family)